MNQPPSDNDVVFLARKGVDWPLIVFCLLAVGAVVLMIGAVFYGWGRCA